MAKRIPYNRGASLNSASHPYASLWGRIKLYFKFPKLNKNSLETIEIEIKKPSRKLGD